MAALTWRDVAAPNFGGVNQAFNNAGVTLDRALNGLSEGLKQFSTERQAGVDNSLLARSLQIQDPDQMRKMLSDGSLLQGVDLSRVNPKVLENLNNRVGTLLNQASTEQGISSSKTSQAATQQNMDFGRQDQTRKTQQQMLEDAARPELARQLGLTGALAALPLEQQRATATTNSSLASAELSRAGQRISNASGSFNLGRAQRDDAANQNAMAEVSNLIQNNATIDDLRLGFEQTEFKSPQARANALKQLETVTGQRLYAPVDTGGGAVQMSAPGGAKGNAPIGSGGGDVQSTEARQALQEVGRRVAQNNSVGVVADIEKNLGDTRSAPEVVKSIGELFPAINHGKLTGMVSEAMSQNPNLSAADVASAITRSVAENHWYSSSTTSFGDGVGVDDDTFAANLKSIASGKADYMSIDNQRTRAAGNQIKSADKALADAKSELSALQRRAQSQTNIDTSRAEERVQRLQQRLDDAIQRQQDNPAAKPIRSM